MFRHGHPAYRQQDEGLIDRDGLLSVLAPTRAILDTEVGKEVRAILARSLQRGYVAFVEEGGLLCGAYTCTSSDCDLNSAP
jgi:hypothetical protein